KHFPGHRNFGDAMTMNLENLPDFDLLVGGPPCQAFSQQRSAHPAEEVGWDDPRSNLVKRFIELRKVKAPLHFLMENVGSMKVDVQDHISDELLTEPIRINSNQFTAQCRDRIYWCSWRIPIPLPKPSPSLSDILELSPASDTLKWKDLPKDPPTNLIAAISRNTATKVCTFKTDGKSQCLMCRNDFATVVLVNGIYRHYTTRERERLQGLPDGYVTDIDQPLSVALQNQVLGNAMTLPVMEYILKQL
ncbi:hypothetical protein HKX48_003064, partial [Thoreauomyces humboldtii]